MRKSIKKQFLIFILLLTACIIVANGQQTPVAATTQVRDIAEQIIDKSKNSISKKVKIQDIKSINIEFNSIKVRSDGSGQNKESTAETNLFFLFPNQIRLESYNDFTTNQQLSTEILNLNKYSRNSELFVDGKPFNPVLPELKDILPKVTEEQKIIGLKSKVFSVIFPILMQSSWYENSEFKYIGQAESKDGKVDVIETTGKNNINYQLFFDKKTYLLMMMIEKLQNPLTNKEVERKSYYSDYKETGGLLVAHKIVVQTDDTATEERQIKKLEINPTFKSNLFETKK